MKATIKESYLRNMNKMSGMDAILGTFNSVSKEEWLSKIKADLRGRATEEMNWDFDDQLSINPFVHIDDVQAGKSDISFNSHWEIAEEFKVIDEVSANREILEALKGGCEVIMLNMKEIPDWPKLLEGVNPGMIKTYLIPGAEEITHALIASAEDFLRELPEGSGAPVFHVRNNDTVIGGPAHLYPDRTVIEGLAKTINDGIQLITQSYHQETLECVVEIGNSYFVEISRLRALRILWSNSLTALGLNKPSLFVEGRFSDRDISDDVHYNMIAAGSKALSAICGGVDRLIIAPSDVRPNSFHRRISRNIHHILRYESKLDIIDDPVKGSYYIENLTNQMVVRAWSRLVEMNK